MFSRERGVVTFLSVRIGFGVYCNCEMNGIREFEFGVE